MHSFLLVPFHSWRITHSAHHKATGNLEKDTAFVPHTRESWIESNIGPKADAAAVELAHLAEDAPLVVLYNCIVHQLLGWPGYLFLNLTGQQYPEKKFPYLSHFMPSEEVPFWKKEQVSLIWLSDFGVLAMIGLLALGGQIFGHFNMFALYVVPYLWVNNWIGKYSVCAV